MNSIYPRNRSFLLQTLCESNFRKLIQLVPDLRDIDQLTTGRAEDKPNLYLIPVEIGPYTTTLELSHRFDQTVEPLFEPAVKMRVYFDARSVEVLRDNERPMVKQALNKSASAKEIMNYKWELNYFLEKWLNHCLKDHYIFKNTENAESSIPA
jgi:uncharacterized protein YqiB (DUF1249 family)